MRRAIRLLVSYARNHKERIGPLFFIILAMIVGLALKWHGFSLSEPARMMPEKEEKAKEESDEAVRVYKAGNQERYHALPDPFVPIWEMGQGSKKGEREHPVITEGNRPASSAVDEQVHSFQGVISGGGRKLYIENGELHIQKDSQEQSSGQK